MFVLHSLYLLDNSLSQISQIPCGSLLYKEAYREETEASGQDLAPKTNSHMNELGKVSHTLQKANQHLNCNFLRFSEPVPPSPQKLWGNKCLWF